MQDPVPIGNTIQVRRGLGGVAANGVVIVGAREDKKPMAIT